MELNELICSHGYRRLEPLKNFQYGDEAAPHVPDQVQSSFVPNEELLGIYKNSDTDPHANLVFTTRGVYRFAGNWVCFEYTHMADVTVFRDEHFDLQTADTLILHDVEGRVIKLTVSGAVTKLISGYERRFPDLFPVLQFLDRVIARTLKDQL